MSYGVWVIIAAAGVTALYLWYATIIARRNKVQEALSSVDVHLNQRHDLIPNIVALPARFMAHERALLYRSHSAAGRSAHRDADDARRRGQTLRSRPRCSSNLCWYFWGLISAGVIYGAYAQKRRNPCESLFCAPALLRFERSFSASS